MLSQYLQYVRDIVLTVGTAVTAISAILGIRAWRRQLVGKERNRISAELLKAAIRWREAMHHVRMPMMYAYEMAPLVDEQEKQFENYDDNTKDQARGYQRRWNKVIEAHQMLETAVIDAEIYLGDWSRKWFTELLTMEHKLQSAVWDLLYENNRRRHLSDKDIDRAQERDKLVFGGSSDDAFRQNIEDIVGKLLAHVKSHVS
jgi:hypothetical protein